MRGLSFRSCAAALSLLQVVVPFRLAYAQPKTPRIAALELSGSGLPREAVLAATLAVRRALGRNPRFLLAPGPAIPLRSMLLALGCAALDPPCLAKIGKQLEVDQIAFGSVEKSVAVYRIQLHLYDVAAGKELRVQDREVAEAEGSQALESALEDMTALLVGETLELTVESDSEGAVILVNGQPVGTTPTTVTEGLRAGTNDIVVRQRGREDFVAKVVLRPGKPQKIRATLRPAVAAGGLATPPGAQKDEERPFYKKWWFWTIVGAAVVGGTATALVLRNRGGERPPNVGVEF
jgi:hypothetical protein